MYTYNARLIRVKDGDTIEADIDLGFHLHYFTSIRLAGLNAPEKNTPEGVRSKEYLESILTPTLVVETRLNQEFEKYGRVLGTLTTTTGVNINQKMLTEGYAVKSK